MCAKRELQFIPCPWYIMSRATVYFHQLIGKWHLSLRFEPSIQMQAEKYDSSNVFFKSLNTAYTNAAILQFSHLHVGQNWKWPPQLSKSALTMTAQVTEVRKHGYNEWQLRGELQTATKNTSDWDAFGFQLPFLCANTGVTSIELWVYKLFTFLF